MQSVIRRLRAHFASSPVPGVLAVYLFGSTTRGQAHRESDVDIGVLLDRSVHPSALERSRLRVALTADLIHALRRNEVDVVILNDAPPELAKHVATRGVPVVVDDPEANHAFVRDAQLRAADIKPFLARMRRLWLEYAIR